MIVLGKGTAKPTERSYGKGDGAKRGIVRFWKGWSGRWMVVLQSLRLDGRKVCNIKMVGISQAKRNKATVCALPPIHLPLTREASLVRDVG